VLSSVKARKYRRDQHKCPKIAKYQILRVAKLNTRKTLDLKDNLVYKDLWREINSVGWTMAMIDQKLSDDAAVSRN